MARKSAKEIFNLPPKPEEIFRKPAPKPAPAPEEKAKEEEYFNPPKDKNKTEIPNSEYDPATLAGRFLNAGVNPNQPSIQANPELYAQMTGKKPLNQANIAAAKVKSAVENIKAASPDLPSISEEEMQTAENKFGAAAGIASGIKGAATGAGIGTGIGAGIGSIVPVLGTAAGAGIGAVIGGGLGFAGGLFKKVGIEKKRYVDDLNTEFSKSVSNINTITTGIKAGNVPPAEGYLMYRNELKDIRLIEKQMKILTDEDLSEWLASASDELIGVQNFNDVKVIFDGEIESAMAASFGGTTP